MEIGGAPHGTDKFCHSHLPGPAGRPAGGHGAGLHRAVFPDFLPLVPARQTTVYGGAGYQVQVRDGFVTSVRDDNKGFTKLYEQGVLTSITFDNPLGEAVTLCTPFQVDSYLEYPVRTTEEARTIRESVDAEGAASLRDQGLRCWELDNGYLVVET